MSAYAPKINTINSQCSWIPKNFLLETCFIDFFKVKKSWDIYLFGLRLKRIMRMTLLIDWQFIVSWGTDSSYTEVLDFTTVPDTLLLCLYSHMNYPWLNFWEWYFLICNYFVFLIILSGSLFIRSAQPPILTEVTIMLDDYFKANPGVKD